VLTRVINVEHKWLCNHNQYIVSTLHLLHEGSLHTNMQHWRAERTGVRERTGWEKQGAIYKESLKSKAPINALVFHLVVTCGK